MFEVCAKGNERRPISLVLASKLRLHPRSYNYVRHSRAYVLVTIMSLTLWLPYQYVEINIIILEKENSMS